MPSHRFHPKIFLWRGGRKIWITLYYDISNFWRANTWLWRQIWRQISSDSQEVHSNSSKWSNRVVNLYLYIFSPEDFDFWRAKTSLCPQICDVKYHEMAHNVTQGLLWNSSISFQKITHTINSSLLKLHMRILWCVHRQTSGARDKSQDGYFINIFKRSTKLIFDGRIYTQINLTSSQLCSDLKNDAESNKIAGLTRW